MLEPLAGHPLEMRQFVTDHLEAPFEGTVEAKRKAQDSLLAQFPGIGDQLRARREKLEREAKRRAESDEALGGESDTPGP